MMKSFEELVFPERSIFYQDKLAHKRHVIKSFTAKMDAQRTVAEKFADYLTSHFGTVAFFTVNVIWFIFWILANSGLFPFLQVFDPFPFGLLTMIVSLEAIALAIFVLISQNREARIADLREEVDLQINTMAEEEITKVMKITTLIAKKQGIDLESDMELKKMLKPLDTSQIEEKLEKEIG